MPSNVRRRCLGSVGRSGSWAKRSELRSHRPWRVKPTRTSVSFRACLDSLGLRGRPPKAVGPISQNARIGMAEGRMMNLPVNGLRRGVGRRRPPRASVGRPGAFGQLEQQGAGFLRRDPLQCLRCPQGPERLPEVRAAFSICWTMPSARRRASDAAQSYRPPAGRSGDFSPRH